MGHRPGQAYAQDLRDRVLAARGTIREVARRFEVSDSYVCRVRAKHRATGDASAGAQRNHVPARLAALYEVIRGRACAEAHNDERIVDLRAWLEREHGVRVTATTVQKTLRRLGVRRNRRSSTPSSNSAPT
jgi:transposase